MDTPIIQSAREGSDDTIRCEVKGDPEPTVMWYFNGQSILCIKKLNINSYNY